MKSVEASPVACFDDIPREPRHLTTTETAAIAKALGSPTRLEILGLFHTRCPRTVGEIAAEIPLAQSTVSVHLHILSNAGVIRTFRSGPRTWHCLSRSVIDGFAIAVANLVRRPDTT